MVQKENNLELEVILILIKNKVHLREIARLLNESHSTILRKINNLTKENILDYRKEGEKKNFFFKKKKKKKKKKKNLKKK